MIKSERPCAVWVRARLPPAPPPPERPARQRFSRKAIFLCLASSWLIIVMPWQPACRLGRGRGPRQASALVLLLHLGVPAPQTSVLPWRLQEKARRASCRAASVAPGAVVLSHRWDGPMPMTHPNSPCTASSPQASACEHRAEISQDSAGA